MSAADVARGLVNLARLPGAIIQQMKNRNGPQTPRTVAYYTSQSATTAIEPEVVLGILMFKIHRHDLRNTD